MQRYEADHRRIFGRFNLAESLDDIIYCLVRMRLDFLGTNPAEDDGGLGSHLPALYC